MKAAVALCVGIILVCLTSISSFAGAYPKIVVTPSSVYLRPNQSTTFHAVVIGVDSQTVLWSASKGTITENGTYTATDVAGPATITARWAQDPRAAGRAAARTFMPPTVYAMARTDQNTEQLPSAMPSWGGNTGIGKRWCNPAFSNLCTIRATDGHTAFLSPGGTLQTADSGELALWAVDSKHLIVKTTKGTKYVIGFNPVTQRVSRTPFVFKYSSLVFSHTDPLKMFAVDGTKVRVIQMASNWSAVASDTVYFDFAACLPSNFKVKWQGSFGVALDDNSFRVAFSNTGSQGSGIYLAAYQTEKTGSIEPGCYVFNTQEGTVTGPNGLIGSIDDGVNPLPDRFTMHAGGGGQNPLYSLLEYSMHQPDGSSGCLAGDCKADNPYVWEIGTTHVRTCPTQCDGHSARGYEYWATGKHYRIHAYADPTQPLTPLATFPAGFPDQHGSWLNDTADDTSPAFLISSDVDPVYPYPSWGYDEVLAVASDGTQKVWRFGQTLNSGLSQYFIVQNAIGVVSQDGNFVAFTSDMCGAGCPSPAPLGYEDGTKIPRGDVFIMEAK